MKISLEWMREFLPGEALDGQRAADALTGAGLPVESIEQLQPPIGPDTVIDVEVTSNRGDCLSHVGVARELSALLKRAIQEPRPQAKESATVAASMTSVRVEAPELCPLYTARIIRNVKIQPSPRWLARRLESVGLRPINNIVDVTNYVLFEMGQPLHAFDLDKLAERCIVVRRARDGETIVSIDGHVRRLSSEMLVIADAQRPVALAGVMGGRDSEVSDATTNILLESAIFDPLSVRKTARALAMKSDSSYRFERGIDPLLPPRASLRAGQLILETVGGELLGGIVSVGGEPRKFKALSLRMAKLRQVLGIDLPVESAMDALGRLNLSPERRGDRIDVTVPSYRLDLNIEVDLIEEIARLIGYDAIPVRDEISIRVTPPEPQRKIVGTIRGMLVGGGYHEAITFSFVSDLLAGDFVPSEAASLPRADASVRKADARLRPSLLPGLLEAVRRNETAGVAGAKLFEIGSTFWTNSDGTIDERNRLGLVGSEDLHEVRGMIESLLEKLNRRRELRVIAEERAGFAASACGRIEWGGRRIGFLGQISPAVAQKLGLRVAPAAVELELSALIENAQLVPQLSPLPRFPAVRRDLSLIVSEATRYEQIESLIRQLKPQSLDDVEYVTTYRGKPLEKGQKSVTVTLVFRSSEGTLTSEQVESQVQPIVDEARQKLGATLRV